MELSRLELLVMIVATGIAWLLLAAGLIHMANVRLRRHLAPPAEPEPLPEPLVLEEEAPEPEPDEEPRAVVILTASVPTRGRGHRDG